MLASAFGVVAAGQRGRPMVRRADFEDAEWSVVVRAPALAVMHVVAAHGDAGPGEFAWLARIYSDARRRHDTELIDDIAAQAVPVDALEASAGEDRPLDRALGGALDLVGRHAGPGDVEAYRSFTLTVAGIAAGSERDRGPRTRAAMDEIATALVTEPGGEYGERTGSRSPG